MGMGMNFLCGDEFFMRGWVWDSETRPRPAPLPSLYMGHSPNKLRSSPSQLCSGTSITLMITGSSHLCSHQQQVDDHCKRKDHTTKHTTTNRRVSQSPTIQFHHAIKYTFTVNYTYVIQACYDFQINTLRLDSTHPDMYNQVGFSGCLHLWWISLLTPS